eukprot:TRINITY_DN68167_c0_g1_i1.p1 TRINITY_DN68167_c0_g1~~TRINITY_DN68167_c0_g1_i1.p1  ORF type:complete len:344 (+),score=83.92 TRINITY_DN68167_c0_g1_i1:54-1085(+)
MGSYRAWFAVCGIAAATLIFFGATSHTATGGSSSSVALAAKAEQLAVPEPTPLPTAAPPRDPRIVVVVFPSTVERLRNPKRVEVIKQTWGRHLNVAYMGFDEFKLPANLSQLHQGSTPVIKWLLDRSLQKWPDLEWWIKADDLTYFVTRSLKSYLASRDTAAVELLGRRLSLSGGPTVFCSGGAGFALSRGAVGFLQEKWCEGSGWTRNEGGDIAIAQCLPQGSIVDTRDATGGERFNAYGPQRLMSGMVDKWYRDYTTWYNITSGTSCCARDTITFHYVEHGEASALYEILTHASKYRGLSDAERLKAWPPQGPTLSYYSTHPKANDKMWDLLLNHMVVEGE